MPDASLTRTAADAPRAPRPIAVAAPDMPVFRARLPWIGGDLQTLRTTIRRAFGARPERFSTIARARHEITLGDGDRLLADLMAPARPRPGAPMVVLIHGLTGCQDSAYICTAARSWLDQGHRVARLNLRGAGPGRPLARGHYHAGRSEDLAVAFADLAGWSPDGLIAVGYSLGGNMLLKYMGQTGPDAIPLAAVAVSPPIRLRAAQQRLMRPRNALYQRYLLSRMKAETLAPEADVAADVRRDGLKVRTVFDFDDVVVAPLNGFSGALDYYARCSAADHLAGVAKPTLVVHGADDPWIPADDFDRIDWTSYPAVAIAMSRGGGHVGFHAKGLAAPWSEVAAGRFCRAVWPAAG